MSNAEEAEACIASLSATELMGKVITVDKVCRFLSFPISKTHSTFRPAVDVLVHPHLAPTMVLQREVKVSSVML